MKLTIFGLFSLLLVSWCQVKPTPKADNLERYNELVKSFVSKDFQNEVDLHFSKGKQDSAVVFTGSSTMTGWKGIDSVFAPYNAINRGIGGSSINHIIHNGEKLIFSNNPSMVVLYIGDNDMYAFSMEQFEEYIKCFIDNFRHRRPLNHLILLSIKPSPDRVNKYEQYIQINATYQKYAANDSMIHYVDIWTPIIKSPELYFRDPLHLNEAGYQIITERLKPLIDSLY